MHSHWYFAAIRRTASAPEVDMLAVRDTTLHASTSIRLRRQSSIRLPHEGIVVPTAAHFGSAKARTDLERFRSGYGHHGVRKEGFELVETGFAETGGYLTNDAGDGAANRVVGRFRSKDALRFSSRSDIGVGKERVHLLHSLRRLGMRTPYRSFVDVFPRDRIEHGHVLLRQLFLCIIVRLCSADEVAIVRMPVRLLRCFGRREEGEVDFADAGDKGDDLDAVRFSQVLFGDRSRRYSACALVDNRFEGRNVEGRTQLLSLALSCVHLRYSL